MKPSVNYFISLSVYRQSTRNIRFFFVCFVTSVTSVFFVWQRPLVSLLVWNWLFWFYFPNLTNTDSDGDDDTTGDRNALAQPQTVVFD